MLLCHRNGPHLRTAAHCSATHADVTRAMVNGGNPGTSALLSCTRARWMWNSPGSASGIAGNHFPYGEGLAAPANFVDSGIFVGGNGAKHGRLRQACGQGADDGKREMLGDRNWQRTTPAEVRGADAVSRRGTFRQSGIHSASCRAGTRSMAGRSNTKLREPCSKHRTCPW